MKHSYAIGLFLAMSIMPAVPRITAAATPTVILSEIAWAGSAASTADEWIELANIGETPALLGGWQLTGVGTGGAAITLPEGTLLNPASTYLISNYAFGDEKTTLNVETSFVTTTLSILNSSLAVSLLDETGLSIDSYADLGTPDVGSSETFASMERDTSTLSWASAETSTNLLNAQLGSPGVIGHVSAAPLEILEPETPIIVEEPVIIEEIVPEDELIVPAVTDPDGSEPQSTDPVIEIIEEPVLTDTTITETGIEALDVPLATVDTPVTPEAIEPAVILDIAPTSTEVVNDEANTEQILIDEAVLVTTEAPPPVIVESESSTVTEMTESEPVAPNPTVHAGDIVISSIYPSPNTGDDEWIALTNTTNAPIDLAEFTIIDASGAITTLTEILHANATIYVLNPKGNLNNNGDALTILDAFGNVIDSAEYGTETFPAPKKGAILLFTSPSLTIEAIDTPTPQAYETPSSTTEDESSATNGTSTDLPTPSSDARKTQSTSVATTSTSIPPAHTTTNIATRVAKSSTPKKTSVRSTSTRKASSTAPQTVSAEEIHSLPDDTTVSVEGIVVALPGSIGKRSFFIDGLEVYQRQGDLAVLALGDHVRITGSVSVLSEYRRVNIQAGGVTVLGTASPIAHEYSDVLPYGSLVQLTGTVSARDGNAILLRIDAERTVTIAPATGIMIRWEELAGKIITVTGILKNARDPHSIILRNDTDIVVVQDVPDAMPAATTSASHLPRIAFFALIPVLLVGFGVWIWRNRPQSSLTKLTLHAKPL